MSDNSLKPLKLLLVEDSEDDALLLIRELKQGGYVPEYLRVDSEEGMYVALGKNDWDIVITDHNLPGFGSERAIEIVSERGGDVPVIIVSGSIGEDVAVSAMKAGAHDYIMKNNLKRLVPAIERELREAVNRKVTRQARDTIHHMAYHDALTGLANRHEFKLRLDHAINLAVSEDCTHILIYLDLDQFKIINDTCGHHAGDELLRQLGVLLRDAVRESDCLARLGGDEFGILLEYCSMGRAKDIAGKILSMVRDFRFSWDGKSFVIGASMGMVVIDGYGKTASDVLKSADMACYLAKDKGRNRYHIYSIDDKEMLLRHGEMEWVSRINHALQNDQFVLYQQGIFPVQSEGSASKQCEFLIRLDEGNDEIILPGTFLPAAERYNLMPALDRWVIKTAFTYIASKHGTGDDSHRYFINLSGASLSDKEFFDYINAQIKQSGIMPSMICFEITETAAISSFQEAVEFIRDIRSLGCKIALDDFGSGLSSFSYLKAIPADFLKIDGNFVKDIVADPMDRAIVEAVTQIARVAGLETIAEFVENDAIMNEVRSIGVDFAQGYGLHHPEAVK